jgi:hypothetical protein
MYFCPYGCTQKLIRGASVQVPSVVPAQGTEGASDPPLPLNSFFIAPNVWMKFIIRHPGVSYSEFLLYRAQRYRVRNESAKRFFTEFSKDPECRDAILRECVARQAVKHSSIEPFVDEGVVPKSEPVEEGIIGPPDYVYLILDASSGGVAVVKTEQT